MKKLLTAFFLYLLVTVCLLKGQDVNVNVNLGPEFTASKKSTLSGILGYDNSGYYVLQYQAKGFRSITLISHFSKELGLTKQVELEPTFEDKDLDVESIYYMNGKIYLFTSFKNVKTGKKYLFYQTVNKSTLTPNNDLKKIDEIDFDSKNNSGEYAFRTSKDSTKILLVKYLPYEKEQAQKFDLKVYDKDVNLIWEKSTSLPFTGRIFVTHKILLGNDENVYILGRLYEEKLKEVKKGKVNYSYRIVSYKKDKTEKQYTVSLGEKFITDLQINLSDKGQFVCAGFYSNQGTYSIDGTYYMKIDIATDKVTNQHTKEFPTAFLTQYESEKVTKKAEKKEDKGQDLELYEFELDELIIKEDGGAYLIGEQYYVRIVRSTYTDANGNTRTTTTYYYNYHDIIVTCFKPDGSIDWWEKIPKRQVSANDGGFYSSYVRAVVNDQLHFIFNDHIENLDTWTTGKMKNYTAGGKGVVTIVSLGKDGKQKRAMLFKVKDIESITVPKVSEQISKNELIIYGQRKKTHQFSKVIFQ